VQDGILTHTNHFRDPRLTLTDRRVRESSSTVIRLDRINRQLALVGDKIGREDVLQCLLDHANYPLSVCMHGDPRKPEVRRSGTLATVFYDLETREIWLAVGNPCESEFVGFSVVEILAAS